MNLVIFGLSVSSAWGNGHATLWRGMLRALVRKGHTVHFFERDTPYYAQHRDFDRFPDAELHLYKDWDSVFASAQTALASADAGIITSYCPDGIAASDLLLNSPRLRTIFYDMDTPVTLSRLQKGETLSYLPPQGLAGFDLVLSYTGGEALDQLRCRLHARCAATLYGWVDPDVYHRVEPDPSFQASLSYLGTYSSDRQPALADLLLIPAAHLPHRKFVIGGAMYPDSPTWPNNVSYFSHVSPPRHAQFYSSSPLTLNITRASMAAMGYCPSGRLFEAAACGTAVVSDWWTGLDTFFEPGKEILVAGSTAEAVAAIERSPDELRTIGAKAKERALDCHTADIRADRLLRLIETPVDETGASLLSALPSERA